LLAQRMTLREQTLENVRRLEKSPAAKARADAWNTSSDQSHITDWAKSR
jgi:hypothetical protein